MRPAGVTIEMLTRSSLIVVPGARIEVVAYAHVGGRGAAARPKAKAKAKKRAPAKRARPRR